MTKNRIKWVVIAITMLFHPTSAVNASEVQQGKTTGSIGFTGVYEPIGTPNPTPPETIVWPPITEVAKPGGTLPQTNDNGASRLLWLGILIISFVFLFWKRKNKQIQN